MPLLRWNLRRVALGAAALVLCGAVVVLGARRFHRTRVRPVPPPTVEPLVQGETQAFRLARNLLEARAGLGNRKVRVLHFGDSHVASDAHQIYLRGFLQQVFGDGGLGWVMPWTPPRSVRQPGVAAGCSTGWTRYMLPTLGEDCEAVGLGGGFLETSLAGERAWLDAKFAKARIYYLRQPSGGGFRIFLDGRMVGVDVTEGPRPAVGSYLLEADGADRVHRLELASVGNGPVRILGVSLEGSRAGVIYSGLGVVGARAEFLLRHQPERFAQLVAAEAPDLVLLAFGTNESSGSVDPEALATQFRKIVAALRAAHPLTEVWLVGPPDRGLAGDANSHPGVAPVVMAERLAAQHQEIPFYDQQAAMGGPGSNARWVEEGLALEDHVHYAGSGYSRLARFLALALCRAHETTKSEAAFRTLLARHPHGSQLEPWLAKVAEPPAAVALEAFRVPREAGMGASASADLDQNGSRTLPGGSTPHLAPASPRVPKKLYRYLDAQGTLVISDRPVSTKDPSQGLLPERNH